MRQLSKRVSLVHELRELRTTKELANCGNYWPDVDQCSRSRCGRVHLRGHALFYNAFHSQETNTELVLDQFTNGSHSAVTQMVDIVIVRSTVVDRDHAPNQLDDVVSGERADRFLNAQSAVQLISTDTTEVVFTVVEKEVLDKLPRIVDTRRLARS